VKSVLPADAGRRRLEALVEDGGARRTRATSQGRPYRRGSWPRADDALTLDAMRESAQVQCPSRLPG